MICDNCILKKVCKKSCINFLEQLSQEYIFEEKYVLCPFCGQPFKEISPKNCKVFTSLFSSLRDCHSDIVCTRFLGHMLLRIYRINIEKHCVNFDKNDPKKCWNCIGYILSDKTTLYLKNKNKLYMIF